MGADVAHDEFFALPASWRKHVLPRRGGPAGARPHAVAAGLDSGFVADSEVESTLRAAPTPPDVAEAGLAALAAGTGGDSPLGVAAVGAIRLGLLSYRVWMHPDDIPPRAEALGARWLERYGLSFTVAACAALAGLRMETDAPQHLARSVPGGNDSLGRARNLWVASRVRAALAAADDEDYAACVGILEPYHEKLLSQRVMAAFLAPSETRWHAGDVAAVLASAPSQVRSQQAAAMISVVTEVDAIGRLAAPANIYDLQVDPAPLYTAMAATGPRLAPVLSGLLTRAPEHSGTGHLQRRLRSMLTAMQGAEAPAAPPARASTGPAAAPEPAADPARAFQSDPPRLTWGPGERETWAALPQRRPDGLADHMFVPLAAAVRLNQRKDVRRNPGGHVVGFSESDFFVHGPDELVRPLLAGWVPSSSDPSWRDTWFYVLVARHEFLALPAVLSLARRKPAMVGKALAPFRTAEVATLMAKWLARTGPAPEIAKSWFGRHG